MHLNHHNAVIWISCFPVCRWQWTTKSTFTVSMRETPSWLISDRARASQLLTLLEESLPWGQRSYCNRFVYYYTHTTLDFKSDPLNLLENSKRSLSKYYSLFFNVLSAWVCVLVWLSMSRCCSIDNYKNGNPPQLPAPSGSFQLGTCRVKAASPEIRFCPFYCLLPRLCFSFSCLVRLCHFPCCEVEQRLHNTLWIAGDQ